MPEHKPSDLIYTCINPVGFHFLLLFFLFITDLFAQGLITDRPDQTESAVTVPQKSLQVETGFLYETFNENNLSVDYYSIAGTLVRYGLFERIELRLGTAYLVNKTNELTEEGFGDFLAGAKINFLNEEENNIDLGLMIHSSLPVGDEAFKPQTAEPEIIAALSKSLSERFSIAFNFGGSQNSSFEKIIYLYTAAAGYSFTDKLGAFLEVYGNFSKAFQPLYLGDTGVTYLVSDFVQLDVSGGRKFSGTDSFWFVGTGISFRINNL